MVKIVSLLALCFLSMGVRKCDNGAPEPPRDIKIYITDYERQAICRKDEHGIVTCIKANELDFEGHYAVTIDDFEKIQLYILELNDRCARWKK